MIAPPHNHNRIKMKRQPRLYLGLIGLTLLLTLLSFLSDDNDDDEYNYKYTNRISIRRLLRQEQDQQFHQELAEKYELTRIKMEHRLQLHTLQQQHHDNKERHLENDNINNNSKNVQESLLATEHEHTVAFNHHGFVKEYEAAAPRTSSATRNTLRGGTGNNRHDNKNGDNREAIMEEDALSNILHRGFDSNKGHAKQNEETAAVKRTTPLQFQKFTFFGDDVDETQKNKYFGQDPSDDLARRVADTDTRENDKEGAQEEESTTVAAAAVDMSSSTTDQGGSNSNNDNNGRNNFVQQPPQKQDDTTNNIMDPYQKYMKNKSTNNGANFKLLNPTDEIAMQLLLGQPQEQLQHESHGAPAATAAKTTDDKVHPEEEVQVVEVVESKSNPGLDAFNNEEEDASTLLLNSPYYPDQAVDNGASVATDTKSVGSESDTDMVVIPANLKQQNNEAFNTPRTGTPLIHVFSPYHDHKSESFAPLNEDQWVALVSASNSRDTYNNNNVIIQDKANQNQAPEGDGNKFDYVMLVCAILQMDAESLTDILNEYCDHVVILPRSTQDVYVSSDTKGFKALPFLQDIIDAGRSVVVDNRDQVEDYYLMLTNADICPTKNFYQYVSSNLQINGHTSRSAISINRMTIEHYLEWPNDHDAPFQYKHEMANEIMNLARDTVELGDWNEHPGHDCFVFRNDMLDVLHLGDQFLGFPRWGGNLNFMLNFMADNYQNLHSNKMGTFHLGDERAWQPPDPNKPQGDMSFWKQFDRQELEFLVYCPLASSLPQDVHTLQNVINCGKIYYPRTTSSGDMIPSFVQPGHEHVFLENHYIAGRRHYLNYTVDGYPDTNHKHMPRIRRWIQTYG